MEPVPWAGCEGRQVWSFQPESPEQASPWLQAPCWSLIAHLESFGSRLSMASSLNVAAPVGPLFHPLLTHASFQQCKPYPTDARRLMEAQPGLSLLPPEPPYPPRQSKVSRKEEMRKCLRQPGLDRQAWRHSTPTRGGPRRDGPRGPVWSHLLSSLAHCPITNVVVSTVTLQGQPPLREMGHNHPSATGCHGNHQAPSTVDSVSPLHRLSP